MQAALRRYPFDGWPKLSHAQVALLRQAARAVPPGDRDALRRTASELLGCELRFEPRSVEVGGRTRSDPGPDVAARLQNDDGAQALLLLEPSLAGAGVDRALGGDGNTGAGAAAAGMDDVVRGALVYVLSRLCHAWDAGWRVHDVLPEEQPVAGALSRLDPAIRLGFRVRLGEQRGAATLWLSAQAVARLRPRPAPSFACLHGLELQLAARAGVATLSAQQTRSLERGDIVIPERLTLERSESGWDGHVDLCLDGSSRPAWHATLETSGLRLEEARSVREMPAREGRPMASEASETDVRLQRLAGDAPVEVSVELARFSLPLEALAELRTGEVLQTGRAIGEQVMLRAGGRTLAYGELVDVEGEIGVRVLEIATR